MTRLGDFIKRLQELEAIHGPDTPVTSNNAVEETDHAYTPSAHYARWNSSDETWDFKDVPTEDCVMVIHV
jgi:hypothetical protein